MSTDGASVMIGIRNGVVTMIKADVPHLTSVHYVAHRLELGIKDSIKQVAYLAKVQDFLLSIYKFYSNSPLNWHNLKETGTALNINVLKPTNVKGTRWIPHHGQAEKQSSRIGLVFWPIETLSQLTANQLMPKQKLQDL